MSICTVDEPNTGYVYFVRFGDLIKVGYARDVMTRLKAHRRQQDAISFLFSVKGSFGRERAFHRYLKQYRQSPYGKLVYTGHEYFAIPEERLSEIKADLQGENGFEESLINKETKQTLFVPRKTHRRFQTYCHKNKRSLQSLFTEMMNSWLVSHGEPEMYDSEGNEL